MGKVTKIEEQKRNKQRVNIYVDGNYSFAVSAYAAKKNGIKEGDEIDEERMAEIAFVDDLEKAKAYVTDYHLSKTFKIIRQKLKEKGYSERVIEEVEEFLKKYKLVNDAYYAKTKSKDMQNLGKKSKGRIKFELMKNGVSTEEIEDAMAELDDDLDYQNAYKEANKKVNEYIRKSENYYEFKGRLYRCLASKSFDGDTIAKVIAEFEERWNESESE